MNNQYNIFIVSILILLAYILFCKDALTEHFENDEKIGQCMSMYSKSLLNDSDIKLTNNDRTQKNCPTNSGICKFDGQKCVPIQQNTTDQNIQAYCQKEQSIDQINDKELCQKIGYTWSNDKCNTFTQRTQDECPNNLCDWDKDINSCQPKQNSNLYDDKDYDSVQDYCQHLKSLTPIVDKKTCDNMGTGYKWDTLINKCINTDINTKLNNDLCWGTKTEKDCYNDKNDKNCVWIPTIPKILGKNKDAITSLRETELENIKTEVNHLDKELTQYLDTVGEYQTKMDKEQSAALVINMIDKDNKDRYKYETKLNNFTEAYQKILN